MKDVLRYPGRARAKKRSLCDIATLICWVPLLLASSVTHAEHVQGEADEIHYERMLQTDLARTYTTSSVEVNPWRQFLEDASARRTDHGEEVEVLTVHGRFLHGTNEGTHNVFNRGSTDAFWETGSSSNSKSKGSSGHSSVSSWGWSWSHAGGKGTRPAPRCSGSKSKGSKCPPTRKPHMNGMHMMHMKMRNMMMMMNANPNRPPESSSPSPSPATSGSPVTGAPTAAAFIAPTVSPQPTSINTLSPSAATPAPSVTSSQRLQGPDAAPFSTSSSEQGLHQMMTRRPSRPTSSFVPSSSSSGAPVSRIDSQAPSSTMKMMMMKNRVDSRAPATYRSQGGGNRKKRNMRSHPPTASDAPSWSPTDKPVLEKHSLFVY